MPDVQERLVTLGFEPDATSPAELAALIKSEIPRWAGVIKSAGVGRTVLVVEHDMDALFGLADRVAVLHMGRDLAVGPPGEIRDNPIVHTAYLGVRDEAKPALAM